ncbi:glucose-6-phosphate dehydrogenase [Puniceicoccaceae bacterium K14]|nr:glucose-6-phosphate dehydrogenase [Puniceicoccaceae bacterium K14]
MSEESRHPFLKGLSKHRGAQPTIITIFGASGDLCARKLVPAIYNLAVDNLLPADFYLIGYGRKPIPDEEFREVCTEAISKFSRRKLDKDIWKRIEEHTYYCSGGYDELAAFEKLKAKIDSIEKDLGRAAQSVCYVSTPPSVFEPIIKNLGACGLATKYQETDKHTKVVVEKPFGKDLASAQNLNRVIQGVFQERQVYRIDHYLGKETVQDLLVQRFANSIFEPLWNRQYVENVQITVAESLGVGTRGGYYEQSGATRDMIQNHTMQLLALMAMEPPSSLNAESIRDEKVKLLKAIEPLNTDYANPDVIRAQYDEGLVDGLKVPGYRQEQGVSTESETETYCALRLNINNWRWQGVPFYLRSGKRMSRRVTEIAIQFKRPPSTLFSKNESLSLASNTLVYQIQPDEGSTVLLNAKIPGLQTRTQPVKMHFKYSTTFGSNTPEAYERLVLDAMIGDGTLFIRGDETEASWNLITPLHEFWASEGRRGMEAYTSGSWGPRAADRMLWANNDEWRRP